MQFERNQSEKRKTQRDRAVHLLRYDHSQGGLVWAGGRREGTLAGTVSVEGKYIVRINGGYVSGLDVIWRLCTGADPIAPIVMMAPPWLTGDNQFFVDRLYLLPPGIRKAPRYRAQSSWVVSWSYERGQYALVYVTADYQAQVQRFCDDLERARLTAHRANVTGAVPPSFM
jgi:hypothetical protein